MESPKFISHTGKGKFFFDGSIVESTFILYLNPYRILIVSEEEKLSAAFFSQSAIRLSGTLDDGRLVKTGPLNFSKQESSLGIEFTALEGVSIGQERDTPPTESRYPLTGYFEGEFTLVHNGWDITTIPSSNIKNAQAVAEKWRCPVEGMMLRIRREGSTKKQHLEFATVVMTLLSLASGTGVSCNRQFFKWEKEELENWRHMTGDEIGPGPIVPEFEVSKFLEQTLSAWQELSPKRRKALRLTLHYINLSALGYLDSRLFHIVQPWEFLAESWGLLGELPESLAHLRSSLQKARKQWKKEYPKADPDGLWGSRISSIFEWATLRDAIERLAASFGLDLERSGLDLNKLKEARDSVAHSGKLPEYLTGSDRQASYLLATGQYCLQLLLLRMLSYTGRVYHATGGSKTFVDINKALTTVRELRKQN